MGSSVCFTNIIEQSRQHHFPRHFILIVLVVDGLLIPYLCINTDSKNTCPASVLFPPTSKFISLPSPKLLKVLNNFKACIHVVWPVFYLNSLLEDYGDIRSDNFFFPSDGNFDCPISWDHHKISDTKQTWTTK